MLKTQSSSRELDEVELEDETHVSEPDHHDEEMGETDNDQAKQTNRNRRVKLAVLLFLLAVIGAVIAVAVVVSNETNHDLTTTVSGWIVDIQDAEGRIFPGTVVIDKGRIDQIRSDPGVKQEQFILPGFVDSHVHIESSLLVPSEFARLAVLHGTVATVSDPHEMANVLGQEGIKFMLDNAEKAPFYFFFGAPSCVPATPFETAGAEITVDDIKELFQDDRIKFLSEMMNYPGVLNNEPSVLAKIDAAKAANRPVDGHAPGLKGEKAKAYIGHGITTDHECFSLEEAQDKQKYGMKIQIRHGSAAQNYENLHPIIGEDPQNVMFCTDDAHPDLLEEQEVDYHVRRSVELGYNLFNVLRIASQNPIEHYKLPVGLLRKGDPADFIVVDNLEDFNVLETWIKGKKVADRGKCLFDGIPVTPINKFKASEIDEADIARSYLGPVRVIVAHDGNLITTQEIHNTTDEDVLKLVVVNRYEDAPPAVAYVKGFKLQTGALATSVAHDSHNVVAVGRSDMEIVSAVNKVIAARGGLAISGNGQTDILRLPVAGLMSDEDGSIVAQQYIRLDTRAKEYGSRFRAPFMTLSFMALLVIPYIKLSDKGLFDSGNFTFVDVAVTP